MRSDSPPSYADLSIRITGALEILTDLERSGTVYGGFAKNCLKRIRETLSPDKGAQMDSPSDAPTCRLEVEIGESRRRYITIEVAPEMADKICEWTMKYNPTATEEQAAVEAVKAAKFLNEEIIHDTYEIWGVDFAPTAELTHPESKP